MILSKNRLKKLKKTIDDDDGDMLNYLKYSHLQPIREDDILKIDKATQTPPPEDKFTQTDKKVMVDKETDTYDRLNKIYPPFKLNVASENFKSKEPSRAENMALAWTTTGKPNTPPSGNSSNSDDEGFMSRNLQRGLRVAELTGNAMITAFTVADTIASNVLIPTLDFTIDAFLNPVNHEIEYEQNEDEQAEEMPSSSVDVPQHEPRDRSRSRDSDIDLGNRLLERGASRSRSITPSSGTASSAKTTPKGKKSDF